MILGIIILSVGVFAGWRIVRSIRTGKNDFFGVPANRDSSPFGYSVIAALDLFGAVVFSAVGIVKLFVR